MSWILVAALVIIWVAFLLPSKKRSPASSVEEFERKMSLLADTNNRSTGRWVLMPRRDERFLGPRERNRVRVRRRRRHVFVALLDVTLLSFLMGLFPPFRVMLVATGALVVLLLAYAAALVQIRNAEALAARFRRGGPLSVRAPVSERAPASIAAMSRAAVADRYGPASPNGSHRFAAENGHLPAPSSNGFGHGNGRDPRRGHELAGDHDELIQSIDDDVHVIVRRAADLEAEELASAAR